MTYFGILVSDCIVRIEKSDCRVLVVEDHELGTNDCRGWISETLFRELQSAHKANLLEREIGRLLEESTPTFLKSRLHGRQKGPSAGM